MCVCVCELGFFWLVEHWRGIRYCNTFVCLCVVVFLSLCASAFENGLVCVSVCVCEVGLVEPLPEWD